MSWTNECTESNQFKVGNVKEVKQVLESMGFITYVENDSISFSTSGEGTFFDDNAEVVLSLKPIEKEGQEEPTNFVGIISDYCMESVDLHDIGYGLSTNDVMVLSITEYLQDQLYDEKEYITVTCAGFESRCSGSYSPFGDVTVITKTSINYKNLYQLAEEFLKK
jgi:hypothetical protein